MQPVTRVGFLWAILAFQLFWRVLAFVWMPLNLQTWPGAFVEASAIASSGCLIVWLVMLDEKRWQPMVIALLLFATLRMLQDAGIYLHSWRMDQWPAVPEWKIFRDAEYQAFACSLVAACALRAITGWRISRSCSCDQENPRWQFNLTQLFLLTAFIAVLFGTARSTWFASFSKWETGVIFLHASTIALAIVPAVLLLSPQLRWAVPLMVVVWLVEPVVIAAYFQFAGWFPFEWEMIRHLITTVGGSATTATMLVLGLRSAGYRLRSLPPAAQQGSIGGFMTRLPAETSHALSPDRTLSPHSRSESAEGP